MRAIDIISKKRDGQPLSNEEIAWFIDAYTQDALPDYQAAALLMAVYLRGMEPAEIAALTLAMAHSGEILDLSDILAYAVDKHSSGGVGDKTSLVVLPLVASCGVPVAKMSGRGLGFSGGTLDKLDAIPGFTSDLPEARFRALAKESGLVLAGQTKALAPADGKLYALRDVTATVASLPLIASSIMSKKLAAGANGIVLDVKVGSGAFMTQLEEATTLAHMMVDIGVRAGRDMVALISDMNQPLGHAVGNALEVKEALETLNSNGPEDLRLHCLEVSAHMLRLAGRGERWTTLTETKAYLEQQLDSGAAFQKFRQMVIGQGGDVGAVDNPSLLPSATIVEPIKAERTAYITQMDAYKIAMAAFELGAGREKKTDSIDVSVGVVTHVKVGDRVEAGAPLVTIHANDAGKMPACRTLIEQALAYSDSPVDPLPLFYNTIYGD